MAWKFRKRIHILPGVHINLSKSGFSTTIGRKGASVNFGPRGSYLNTGIPGTGLYNRQKIGDVSDTSEEEYSMGCMYYLLIFLSAISFASFVLNVFILISNHSIRMFIATMCSLAFAILFSPLGLMRFLRKKKDVQPASIETYNISAKVLERLNQEISRIENPDSISDEIESTSPQFKKVLRKILLFNNFMHDSLLGEVAYLVMNMQSGSASNIQRRFSLGYNRTDKIMNNLYLLGIVGPSIGYSKPRAVLINNQTEAQMLAYAIDNTWEPLFNKGVEDVFLSYIMSRYTNNQSEAITKALELILVDKMNPIELKDALAEYEISVDVLKEQTIDIVLDYAITCLEDNFLSEEELKKITLLKYYFHIADTDFKDLNRTKEVESIIKKQLSKMYADKQITREEAMTMTNLQDTFGLSYDEFESLVNDYACKAVDYGGNIEDMNTSFMN